LFIVSLSTKSRQKLWIANLFEVRVVDWTATVRMKNVTQKIRAKRRPARCAAHPSNASARHRSGHGAAIGRLRRCASLPYRRAAG
jgi:hypothetical protein